MSRAHLAFVCGMTLASAACPDGDASSARSSAGTASANAPAAATFRSGTFEPARDSPDFTLQGTDGKPLTLSAYRGKVVVLEFGFTTCTKICPITLANLAAAFQKLGARASDVQVVFVTVDPARDNVEKLRAFLAAFNPTFLGATGTADELSAVRRQYGVIATESVAATPEQGYDVHHSSSIYLIDRAGKLRVMVPFGKKVDDIVHDIELLLLP